LEATEEYVKLAADKAAEVMSHFIIAGIPRKSEGDDACVVNPILMVSGDPRLLSFVADQVSVQIHRLRLEGGRSGGYFPGSSAN